MRRWRGEFFGSAFASPWVPSAVSPYDDVNSLIADLGGKSNVTSFWDCRAVTASSGNVSAWADVCTVSPGPTLSYFGTGTNPTWAGAGSPVVFSSLGATLATVSSASYVPSGPSTVIIVGFSSNVSIAGFLGINGAAFCDNMVGTNASDWTSNSGNGGTTVLSTAVAQGAIIRVIISTVSSGGGTITAQVYNHAVQSTTTTSTTDTGQFVMGGNVPGAAVSIPCSIYAGLYANSVYTVAQVAAFSKWAIATHSAVAAA